MFYDLSVIQQDVLFCIVDNLASRVRGRAWQARGRDTSRVFGCASFYLKETLYIQVKVSIFAIV